MQTARQKAIVTKDGDKWRVECNKGFRFFSNNREAWRFVDMINNDPLSRLEAEHEWSSRHNDK